MAMKSNSLLLLSENKNQAWELQSADVRQLNGCLAPSRYFEELMTGRLGLDSTQVQYHFNGITFIMVFGWDRLN